MTDILKIYTVSIFIKTYFNHPGNHYRYHIVRQTFALLLPATATYQIGKAFGSSILQNMFEYLPHDTDTSVMTNLLCTAK